MPMNRERPSCHPVPVLLFVAALLATGSPLAEPTGGADLAKEQRWREQIVDSLLDGEAVDLRADELTFLGIYTEADEPTGRAAIIVHGIGVHPDWPQVVQPLRTRLPAEGWSTLSIQMPVLPNQAEPKDYDALMAEVAPRFDAARAFLREQGAEQIVIVAHSMGARMANHYLAGHPAGIDAYVAIGTSGGAGGEQMAAIKLPMLDLYGQQDLPGVVGGAAARRAAGAANPGYAQAVVPGAEHFFDRREEALVGTVVEWLDGTVPRD